VNVIKIDTLEVEGLAEATIFTLMNDKEMVLNQFEGES
jgi:hypothetical protein